MAFQIKDFKSIAASMVNHARAVTRRITDFNAGSTVRTLMESAAIEIDQLYQEMFHGLKEAIPVSTYTTFGFGLLSAGAASGVARFSVASPATADIVIQAGTVVRQPNSSVQYATASQVAIATGGTQVDVLVICTAVGSVGNAPVSSVTEIVGPLAGTVSVTNPGAITNGRDDETEEQRKLRFQAYIASLPRGTPSALEYGAKTAALYDSFGQVTEYVASSVVYEPYLDDPAEPIAYAIVYIHNGAGSTSSSLVSRCQEIIDGYYEADGTPVPGWKAAGVVVDVIAATDTSVNVTCTLSLLSGHDAAAVIAAAEVVIADYLGGLKIGEDAIRNELIQRIMGVDGVYNCSLSLPSADVAAAVGVKLVPGTIAVTVP